MKTRKEKKFNDLGLDRKANYQGYRALNKDGSFNIHKQNVSFFDKINVFHSLVSMSWLRFFSLLLLSYFAVNIIFASLYFIIGTDNLTGIRGTTPIDQFLESFFFSAQTITTLGYGQVAPISLLANIIAATESLLGLLILALATGLMYGRFSKPYATIKYSTHAVIAPYQKINGFMFRVINPKNNQLMEVEVSVTLSMNKDDSDLREFFSLALERNSVKFFPTAWTVVHPITDTSPMKELTQSKLIEKDAEFIVMIKAFDESFSQTVYSRSSYMADELKWGEKFVYLNQRMGNGTAVDVSRIDDTEKKPLN